MDGVELQAALKSRAPEQLRRIVVPNAPRDRGQNHDRTVPTALNSSTKVEHPRASDGMPRALAVRAPPRGPVA